MATKKLQDKVAIVTASTDGIGYHIAKGLAENGAKVVVSSRKEHNVNAAVEKLLAEDLDVSGLVCHVGKAEHRTRLVDSTLDKYGKLDILVLNAGMNPYFGPVLDTPESSWDKIFDTNVKCGFLLAQEVAPHLKKTKGSMLFVSSVTAFTPFPAIGAYSVSKTALLGLVKVLATELGPDGVRVNSIAPGIIETNFSAGLTQGFAGKAILENTPLQRFGLPQDCAGAAVFLSSDDAAYITGETMSINGGMPARL